MDQIQEKFITRFFNEFKKPYFWSIFPILVHNNKKKKIPVLSPTTSYSKETSGQRDGRKDRHYFIGSFWIPPVVQKCDFKNVMRFETFLFILLC